MRQIRRATQQVVLKVRKAHRAVCLRGDHANHCAACGSPHVAQTIYWVLYIQWIGKLCAATGQGNTEFFGTVAFVGHPAPDTLYSGRCCPLYGFPYRVGQTITSVGCVQGQLLNEVAAQGRIMAWQGFWQVQVEWRGLACGQAIGQLHECGSGQA